MPLGSNFLAKGWCLWSLRKMGYEPSERAFPRAVDILKGYHILCTFAEAALPFQSLACRHWDSQTSQS